MGRSRRFAFADHVYHVLNRANDRRQIFQTNGDYMAFLAILAEGVRRFDTRLLAWCIMPNHWHLVLWPRCDGELSRFVSWITLPHTQRRRWFHESVGHGHLYQGRFKSFVVQGDSHYLTVSRYVERNALRANLVQHAQDWPWSSLRPYAGPPALVPAPGPLPRPDNWIEICNTPQTGSEQDALRCSLNSGRPYGDDAWIKEASRQFGLPTSSTRRGRPLKS